MDQAVGKTDLRDKNLLDVTPLHDIGKNLSRWDDDIGPVGFESQLDHAFFKAQLGQVVMDLQDSFQGYRFVLFVVGQ
ncbi:MAG: hypothetical protein HW380_1002 [Magnetococcales bacterium]|nr:hypothetical protein [Magnetococcales bacterium]